MSTIRNYLGSYRLIRLIRGGQTCNVWEGSDDTGSEKVALKVLLEEHKSKKEEVEQLQHEARIGKDMDHPAVIKIFEFVGRYDLPFLVMQLFSAKNLKQGIREIPNFIAINMSQIVQACAEGLEHLHSKGWVHCDVKPDNFLVNEQGEVKLIDFSIAQPLRSKTGGLSSLFGRSKVQGTRSYMSPEQIRGKPLQAPADIYGLGCVLHELLSGKPPFTASNPDELLSKHLRSPAPSLQALNRAVSDDFAQLVNRMLSKDPARRPQTMKDFLQEIQAISIYKAGLRPKAEEA